MSNTVNQPKLELVPNVPNYKEKLPMIFSKKDGVGYYEILKWSDDGSIRQTVKKGVFSKKPLTREGLQERINELWSEYFE